MPYPDTLDSFTNPLASDPRVGHASLHGAVNDAVEALQAKVGTGDVTPATEGEVLYSQGSGVTGYIDVDGLLNSYATTLIKKRTETLSSADILDLHNTPVELVPAPGAGKWVRVHATSEYLTFGTVGYGATSDDPALYWGDNTGPLITNIQSYTGTADRVGGGYWGNVSAAAASVVNQPVVAAVVNAVVDGDSDLTITVWYSIEDVP